MSWQDDEISGKQIALIKKMRYKLFGILGGASGFDYDDYRQLLKTKGKASEVIDWLAKRLDAPKIVDVEECHKQRKLGAREFDILIGYIPAEQADFYMKHGNIKKQ